MIGEPMIFMAGVFATVLAILLVSQTRFSFGIKVVLFCICCVPVAGYVGLGHVRASAAITAEQQVVDELKSRSEFHRYATDELLMCYRDAGWTLGEASRGQLFFGGHSASHSVLDCGVRVIELAGLNGQDTTNTDSVVTHIDSVLRAEIASKRANLSQ
ncbi:MAG: hypothetical protein ACR2QC_04430 [Gammaproteobacteria bacterium]